MKVCLVKYTTAASTELHLLLREGDAGYEQYIPTKDGAINDYWDTVKLADTEIGMYNAACATAISTLLNSVALEQCDIILTIDESNQLITAMMYVREGSCPLVDDGIQTYTLTGNQFVPSFRITQLSPETRNFARLLVMMMSPDIKLPPNLPVSIGWEKLRSLPLATEYITSDEVAAYMATSDLPKVQGYTTGYSEVTASDWSAPNDSDTNGTQGGTNFIACGTHAAYNVVAGTGLVELPEEKGDTEPKPAE